MQFDLVITNPPFQNSVERGKTPHKVWIEFTLRSLSHFLKPDGLLCQVSPSSFQSPSNPVLGLFQTNQVDLIDLGIGRHFPGVGSTFSYYLLWKSPEGASLPTVFRTTRSEFKTVIDRSVLYIPNYLSAESLSIHRKVIFETPSKLAVERDYVTCHNIRLKRDDTLSKTQTPDHSHPVFHTNSQIWWSKLRQPFAGEMKVMWTRSGYTKPFFDEGVHGCTDMGYFVVVPDREAGECLAHNLNLQLFQYVFRTAKWSGFGNEKVFDALPDISGLGRLSDSEMFAYFEITGEEADFIGKSLEPRAARARS